MNTILPDLVTLLNSIILTIYGKEEARNCVIFSTYFIFVQQGSDFLHSVELFIVCAALSDFLLHIYQPHCLDFGLRTLSITYSY